MKSNGYNLKQSDLRPGVIYARSVARIIHFAD